MNNIIEGNKLIAFFYSTNKNYPSGESFYLPNLTDDPNLEPWIHQNRLKFHSEWNWIIPVYIKINKLIQKKAENDFVFGTNSNNYQIKMWNVFEDEDCSIEKLWESIVEFLQWYNSQIN